MAACAVLWVAVCRSPTAGMGVCLIASARVRFLCTQRHLKSPSQNKFGSFQYTWGGVLGKFSAAGAPAAEGCESGQAVAEPGQKAPVLVWAQRPGTFSIFVVDAAYKGPAAALRG